MIDLVAVVVDDYDEAVRFGNRWDNRVPLPPTPTSGIFSGRIVR